MVCEAVGLPAFLTDRLADSVFLHVSVQVSVKGLSLPVLSYWNAIESDSGISLMTGAFATRSPLRTL